MSDHNQLGKVGELTAIKYLIRKGYKIRHHNWRFIHKEIDIIAEIADMLIIVEVKTRSSDSFGHPQEAITKNKIQFLVEATQAYINKYDIRKEIRFDILFIFRKQQQFIVEHIEDAFNAII